jgi:hypothetical protein
VKNQRARREQTSAGGLQASSLDSVKPTPSLLALLAVAACGGVGSANTLAPDGGSTCLVPTVMALLSPQAGGVASAWVDVDLGEVAAGLDPVALTSVHIRPTSGADSLDFVEGARLSVMTGAGGVATVLAGGGALSDDGLPLSLPPEGVDLRAFSSGGRLLVRLELAGPLLARPPSVTLDVCVTRGHRNVTY